MIIRSRVREDDLDSRSLEHMKILWFVKKRIEISHNDTVKLHSDSIYSSC